MKSYEIEFYGGIICNGTKVKIHLRGGKETSVGCIVKENERIIILETVDNRTEKKKEHLIYKAAIMMVEEA